MKRPSFLAAALVGCLLIAPALSAAVVFEDGFDVGTLGDQWLQSVTEQGRVQVTDQFAPAAGTHHLVLDDSVTDAVFSSAAVTLTLDLKQTKNVRLTFKAKSLGNEPHAPPAGTFSGNQAFDGVSVSADGGQTWVAVASLDAVGPTWTDYSVPLDAAVAGLGGSYATPLKIRFSAYDNTSTPNDGIAIDSVSVSADQDQRLALELPASLAEGSVGHTGLVLISIAPVEPLAIQLSAAPSGQLILPATVTVPAGATSAEFSFAAADDDLLNGSRSVVVTAELPGATTASATLTVTDNDTVTASLRLPERVTEGGAPGGAAVVLSRVTTTPITFLLETSPAAEIGVPATVTVASGQSEGAFSVSALNDSRIDGDVTATVTAIAAGLEPATASLIVADNELRELTLSVPQTLTEGASLGGSVILGGTLTTPLTVALTSQNPGVLTLPAEVTIPAGQIQAAFTCQAVDNSAIDGTRTVTITAAADSFTSATAAVHVRDNEVASLKMTSLPEMVNLSSPVTITVTANDVEGNALAGVSPTVELNVVLPDGTTLPLAPPSVTLTNGTWRGSVTLPKIGAAPLRLRAAAPGNIQTESNGFDVLRTLALATSDLVWDPARERLYASQPTSSGNKLVALNPTTLETVDSLTLSNNPSQLALTSGGEFLYCHLQANGSIAKINPADLTLVSSFAIGTDSFFGTLYAEDMCTVANDPDLLVVSTYRASVSPRHNGVVVYDNGIARPTKTQDHTGSNIIEPSADPTIFFGQNTETTEFGFRRIQLTENGLTQLDVAGLFGGFGSMMRSDGDIVYSSGGDVADGAQMRKLGTLGTSGLPCPDHAAFRVYYLQQNGGFFSNYGKITAYDPVSFNPIHSLTLPIEVTEPSSFVRWGATGLAFRTASTLYLINSANLVPAAPPADVSVSVTATPNPATVGSAVSYLVTATNAGPNPAPHLVITSLFSTGQTIQTPVASAGTFQVSGQTVKLSLPSLAPGASVTLTVPTLPSNAGTLSCVVGASSAAVDPVSPNNSASKVVSIGFQPTLDVVNDLRLTVNNLVADPVRNLLWATIPATEPAPLGKSLVSIDPLTGLVSDPIPLNASPFDQCMALSGNGRYLYIGLSDANDVCRLDLTASPPVQTRIPLGLSQWGSPNNAQDIEVLDGDGTSFMIAGSGDHSAAIYDGSTMRPQRSGIYTVDRIERAGAPGMFIGYNNYTSGFGTTQLFAAPDGVATQQTASNLISGYGADIRTSGDLLLSSTGKLINSANFSLLSTLPSEGRPCVDARHERAYLVFGNAMRAYSTLDGSQKNILPLPVTTTGDWAKSCIRWGANGFAITGTDRILITRWTAAIPPDEDTNANGFADAWERVHFSDLGVNAQADPDEDGLTNGIEYLLALDPQKKSLSQITVRAEDGEAPVLVMTYDRLKGLPRTRFRYETSADLAGWQPADNVTETVVSTGTIGSEEVETIQATLPGPAAGQTYLRLRWTGQ